MGEIEELIRRARKTQNGFLDLQRAGDEVVARHQPEESLRVAKTLFRSEAYQARCIAVFILGRLARQSKVSLRFLRSHVSRDPDWRVQEILAKAFDRYCADRGYGDALPTIRGWLEDSSPNVRRAVTEGLRIWTSRPYFQDHPEMAIRLLSRLRSDASEYVRRSVGNALRDISKKHGEEVAAELESWDVSEQPVLQTYRLASRLLKRKGG